MTLQDTLYSLGMALAAGALIGAERQQAQAKRAGADFGGVRTFPLVALSGALGGLLRPHVGDWFPAVLLAAVAALLVTSYRTSSEEDPGVSSEIAAIVTFALGMLATTESVMPGGPRLLVVAAGAAITMALLALKQPLHSLVSQLSIDDVYATVKFVVLAVVVIPLLPNRTLGPLDVFNPFKIGVMITLIAGISFAGYAAARVVGPQRGLLVSGVLGGLVSSTAVTLTFAGRCREDGRLAPVATVAVVAASSMMFARLLSVIAVVDPSLLAMLGPTLGGMAAVGFCWAAVTYRRTRAASEPAQAIALRNPFELRQAVQFGLLYAAVLFVAKAAQLYLGSQALYASAVLSALADVDAITLSLLELHHSGTSGDVVAAAITLAATTNTLVKVGLAWVAGGWALGRRVGLALLTVLAAGALTLAVTRDAARQTKNCCAGGEPAYSLAFFHVPWCHRPSTDRGRPHSIDVGSCTAE